MTEQFRQSPVFLQHAVDELLATLLESGAVEAQELSPTINSIFRLPPSDYTALRVARIHMENQGDTLNTAASAEEVVRKSAVYAEIVAELKLSALEYENIKNYSEKLEADLGELVHSLSNLVGQIVVTTRFTTREKVLAQCADSLSKLRERLVTSDEVQFSAQMNGKVARLEIQQLKDIIKLLQSTGQ